ncbi:MAG: methyltransferase domain-containing protein, partial [Pseudolabrys sp.]
MISARDRIFSDFMSRMLPSPDHRILDVGVSDVVNDGANVLERSYPYQENVTACGLSNAPDFRAAFPKIAYRQIEPNKSLPFEANAFDIAASNAVLEHVGSFEKQVVFVGELCRVARRVFITVPN